MANLVSLEDKLHRKADHEQAWLDFVSRSGFEVVPIRNPADGAIVQLADRRRRPTKGPR